MNIELDQFDEYELAANVLEDDGHSTPDGKMAEQLRNRQVLFASLRRNAALQNGTSENRGVDCPLGFHDRLTDYLERLKSGIEQPPSPVLCEDDPEGPWTTRPDAAKK